MKSRDFSVKQQFSGKKNRQNCRIGKKLYWAESKTNAHNYQTHRHRIAEGLGYSHIGPWAESGEAAGPDLVTRRRCWALGTAGSRAAVNTRRRRAGCRGRGAILLCPSCCRIDAAKETRGWRGLARRNVAGTTGSRAGRLDGK